MLHSDICAQLHNFSWHLDCVSTVCVVDSDLSVSVFSVCLSVSIPVCLACLAFLSTGCSGMPSELAGHGETDKQYTAGLQLIPEAGLTPATPLVAIHMIGSGLMFITGFPTLSPVMIACMRLWLVLTS